jgi:D-aminopeptidase
MLLEEQPAIADDVIIPIVAECDDSFLSDTRRMQVERGDVRDALAAARASAGGVAAEEGAVGAGTGMSCLGYKGGIGTASRVLPDGSVVGVLTLTNFGEAGRLTVAGVPAGQLLRERDADGPVGAPAGSPVGGEADAPARDEAGAPAPGRPGVARVPRPAGSCIVVAITDGPLDGAACQRAARRAGLGLARCGSTAHHGSGEIFLALATGLRAPRGTAPPRAPVTGRALDDYFAAVAEATEEAVINSLLRSVTVTGRDGNTSRQIPVEELRSLVAGYPVRSRP